MSVKTNQAGGASHARRKLLEQAALTVSKVDESALDLEEVASLAEVDQAEARELFADTAALTTGLREFVNARFMHFAEVELGRLPVDATATDKIQAVGIGYYNFSISEKHNFGAFIGLSSSGEFVGFDTDFSQDAERPAYALIMELTREAIKEEGGPEDGWLLLTSAAAFWATMHGFCHLASYGIARYLADAAKKQTLVAIMRTIVAGVKPGLAKGLTHSVVPINFVGNTDFPRPPRAADMPRSNDDEKRRAIWRGAVEQAVEGGLSSVTLFRAAQRAGFERAEATRLLDGDEKLISTLDAHLDEADQAMIGAQCFMVKEGSSSLSYLKAIGYGYVGYALSDPEGFITLISVAAGAIVPASFEVNTFEDSEMGQAFTFLMEITRATIEEGGGPRSAWDLFTQIFALWSTAHGLAHLYAAGALRHLETNEKFLLLGPALDMISRGMVNSLNLDLPKLEYTEILPEHRFSWD